MADNKQIVMEIPKEIIEAQVHAAVVQSLSGGDPARFVRALVEQVLNQEAPGYGRKTILQETVAKMVIEVAQKFIGDWIEEAKPLVRAELDRRFRRSPKEFAAKVADTLCESMKGHVSISVSIESPDGRR